MALAHGHSPSEIDGYTREVVVEEERTGFVAWLRRRCGFLSDPDPVESIETVHVDGMSIADLQRLAAFTTAELAMPFVGDE